jgi:hypothetical protein
MGPASQRVTRPGVRQRRGDAAVPDRPFPHPVEPLVPKPIRVAAVLFALYGLYVAANATAWQALGSWAEAADYPRALLRVFAALLIAWGLWRGLRWAWWLGIGLAGFWVVLGLGAFGASLLIGNGDRPLPTALLISVVPGAVLLVAAVVSLLLSQSRAAFRARAA